MFSMHLPLRGERESATTTRYVGAFVLPARRRRMCTANRSSGGKMMRRSTAALRGMIPAMPVLSASRLRALARRLLGASTLCAIATVAPGGRAHVNTAYFAWSDDYEIVWI